MKVIVAPDSFKECLSSQEVARIVTDEIRKFRADWTLISCPLPEALRPEVAEKNLRAALSFIRDSKK